MTDKEIIIDGVNVTECDFICVEDDYCSYSGITRAYKGECGCSDGEMCKDHPECFYKKALKQLHHKEQEYEELKEKINSLRFPMPDTNFAVLSKDEFEKSDRYKQALEKIEEITKNAKKDICNNCGWLNTNSCNPEDYTCGEFIKIQSIINEVKG